MSHVSYIRREQNWIEPGWLMKRSFLRLTPHLLFWDCRCLTISQVMHQMIVPPRASHEERSHVMPLKCFHLVLQLLLTSPVLADGQEREMYLSMQQFERTVDHAHSQCASVDLEFSQKFYDCFDKMMKGIYIDSSTIHALSE